MARREELIELSGQIVNGIMSSDNSVFAKLFDRGVLIDGTAKMTVEIAEKIIEEIEKKVKS